METLNNMATAAAKAVWGDNEANKEPISGAKGDVSKGQPYDAGNLDEADQSKVESKLDSAHETQPTETKPIAQPDREPEAGAGAGAGIQASAIQPSTQTSTHPAGQPTAEAVPDPKETAGSQNKPKAAEDESADVEVKGPGPRPLNEVAKEHGGDAGSRDVSADSKTSAGSDSTKQPPQSDNPDAVESEGTGEKYIKTTGLAADGGDFDASKPGAGKEADRLLDQKGIHPNEGKDSNESKDHSSSHGHTKDKPSLSERIKAKLHKH